jgi:hypothetical protein
MLLEKNPKGRAVKFWKMKPNAARKNPEGQYY